MTVTAPAAINIFLNIACPLFENISLAAVRSSRNRQDHRDTAAVACRVGCHQEIRWSASNLEK